MPNVITFFNNKGGVGKTTSSVLLADYFETKNKKVLLFDLDSQGNLTGTFFEYEDIREKLSFYSFMENQTPLKEIVLNYSEKIDVIPASMKMDNFSNIDVMFWKDKKKLIREFFESYDVVIIDCPPTINGFSWLGLLLCNYAFIPLKSDMYSKDGLENVLEKFEGLKDFNSEYMNNFCYISAHKGQKRVFSEAVQSYFEEELGNTLLKNKLPEFVGLEERQLTRSNIFESNSNKKQIDRLKSFCKEIENKIKD